MAPHCSTRHWSCSTLNDGVDALLAQADAAEQEEEKLKKLVQDRGLYTCRFHEGLPRNITKASLRRRR